MNLWRSRVATAAFIASASLLAVAIALSIAGVLDYRGGLRAFEVAEFIAFSVFIPAAFLWRRRILQVLALLSAVGLLTASAAIGVGNEVDPFHFDANLPPSDTIRSTFWISALVTFVLAAFALGLALKPSWFALAPVAAIASIALPFVPFLVGWTFVILTCWPLLNSWVAGACLQAVEHRRLATVSAGSIT